MRDLKKISILLIAIIIVIIIIICLLMIMLPDNGEQTEPDVEDLNPEILEEAFDEKNKWTELSEMREYIYIRECINKYISYSNGLRFAEISNDMQEISRMRTSFANLFYQPTLTYLNIGNADLYSELALGDSILNIDNVYVYVQTGCDEAYKYTTDISSYYVEATLTDKNNYKATQIRLIIVLDKVNGRFLIIPEKYLEHINFNVEVGENIIVYDKEEIDNQVDNVFTVNFSVSMGEKVASIYYSDITSNLQYSPQTIYEKLNENYRTAKFSDYNQFLSYLNTGFSDIKKRSLTNYNMKNITGGTEYIMEDQYGSVFIINVTNPLDYEIFLDSYTVDVDLFTDEYEKSTTQERVSLNIQKVFQAINNKDYQYVYGKLNTGFRNNYFTEYNVFEGFLGNKVFEKNKLKSMTYETQGENFICNITLTNASNQSESRTLTLIMKLNEGTNFEIAFSVE